MKKDVPLFIILLGFFLFFAEASYAKAPSVSVQVDKETVTLGDEIVYEIRVTHHSDVRVTFPDEDADFSPFELKRYRPLPRKQIGKSVTEGNRYFLTIFRLGDWKIPSLPIVYTDYRERSLPEPATPGGQRIKDAPGIRRSLSTEPVTIQVKSVMRKETAPTRDIQRLKKPEENPVIGFLKKAGIVLFSIGAVFIGIYATIRLWPKPVPRLSREDPVASALRDLHAFRRAWHRQAVTKAHYDTLSKILRHYLARQFDPLSLDLTTAELHQEMAQVQPCRTIAEKAAHILTASDLVKFANRRASQEEFESFLKETEEIVRMTQPIPLQSTS